MVSGKFKSRSKRRIFVKVPGNAVKVHYRARKPAKPVCAVYGTPLPGVARALPSKIANMPKSKKRPERPFGGILSSKAMREEMRAKARSLQLE